MVDQFFRFSKDLAGFKGLGHFFKGSGFSFKLYAFGLTIQRCKHFHACHSLFDIQCETFDFWDKKDDKRIND
jgi:hypothetical protein